MKPKIEDASLQAEGNKGELSIGFVTSFLLTTLISLVVIYAWDLVGQDRWSFVPRFFVVPWVVAAGQEILNSVNEFSGRSLDPVSLSLRFSALGGMLLIAVLSPTLFLFEMRARAIAHHSNRISWPRSVASIVGAVITIPIVGIILLAPPIQKVMLAELKVVVPGQHNSHDVAYGLRRIAWDIFQYRVKPKSMMNGGGGSVAGYTLPPDLATTPHALYSISPKGESIEVLGRSTRSPSFTITISIDGKGSMSNWRTGGEFRDLAPQPGFWSSLKRLFLSY